MFVLWVLEEMELDAVNVGLIACRKCEIRHEAWECDCGERVAAGRQEA